MENYLSTAFTPGVLAVQEQKGSSRGHLLEAESAERLDDREIGHIAKSDSFYLATVSENGWPYVQHRGGDIGFVKILSPTTIGWLERTGNRQYLGTGNITTNNRISAIFVDYPSRTRLKLLGTATYHPEPTTDLVTALGGDLIRNDGAITIDVLATDWNCPKHITRRFTPDQIAAMTDPLHQRIQQLETELTALTGDPNTPADHSPTSTTNRNDPTQIRIGTQQ